MAAVLCGLLAAGLQVFSTFRVQPWSWRLDSTAMMLATWVLSGIFSLTIPLGLFALIAVRWRSRSAKLSLDPQGRNFVVDGLAHMNAAYCILVMWMAGDALMVERVPGREAMRVAHLPGAVPFSVLAVALLTAAAIWLLFVPMVRVRMSAEGLHVRQLIMNDRVRWDEIAAVEPVRMGLWVHRIGSPKRLGVPTPFLEADPGFLERVINHYVREAQDRAAIGTREELDRLPQRV